MAIQSSCWWGVWTCSPRPCKPLNKPNRTLAATHQNNSITYATPPLFSEQRSTGNLLECSDTESEGDEEAPASLQASKTAEWEKLKAMLDHKTQSHSRSPHRNFQVPTGFQMPPDNAVWSAVFYTAFFATFLGFLIQVKAQSVMSATVAGVLLAMETPFALFFGLYFDNDPITLRIISGGTLVLIAMALVIWSDSKHTNSGVNNSGK